MKGRGSYILVFLFLIALPACRTRNQYASKPAKSLVNPDSDQIEVQAVAFHENDSVTSIFLEVSNENVLYKRPDTADLFYAGLRVSYQLMLEHNSRKILDSGTVFINDRAGAEQVKLKSLYAGFEVDARLGNSYFLHLDVFDMNRRSKSARGINIYKQDKLSEQNFLVRKNDTVAFGNHFLAGEEVWIDYTVPADSLVVDCYFRDFGPALPPFSVKEPDDLKYRPDSSFTLHRSSGSFSVTTPAAGFYHLKARSDRQEGLTLHTFDEHFPGIGSSEEMISCARYIMSREEFDACRNADDKKAAIDKFWLGIAGSNERALELLKRYYGRVKEANKYYSSYTQGWKTDRGMIFIVFGQPANIYYSRKDEVWVYGNEANPATLRFVFNKTSNPFSDNDYVMERSQFYKDQWHLAVDFWREGHVYYDGRR